ncbi:unnamed protein product [Caenorhabditis bovis]|uniref:PRA1 family protein n=1 Tax=Caenorhabditis bovis TaxID=2654633 RepID=A0A8S1EY76_9PELO|nr:unnamed protein product [Caenorhabditis bovis]
MASKADNNASSQNIQLGHGLEVPPFRSVNEFLLETDRYERPSFNDLKKWNNRIISNLLYFQSNYFVTLVGLFLLQSLWNSMDICIGLFAILLVIATLIFTISNDPNLNKIRSDHPLITLGAIIVVFYFFVHVINSVFVVLFAFLFPLFLILLHASFRLRGIANRLANNMERHGIRTTVMGKILERTGISVQL